MHVHYFDILYTVTHLIGYIGLVTVSLQVALGQALGWWAELQTPFNPGK